MKIGKIEIDRETDVEKLVACQLQTGGIWSRKEDILPREGMIRAIATAGDTEIGDRLVQAVAQCLTHSNVSIRSEAIMVVQELPKRFGTNLILSRLHHYSHLYQNVLPPDNSYPYTLEEGLLSALAAIVDSEDRDAIFYLRTSALSVSYRRPIVSRLAIIDTEWVLNHVCELVSGVNGGSVAKGILLCLPSMVAREVFIYQLKVSPPLAQEQILFALQQDTTFKRVIPEADRQKLLVLLQFKIN